MSDSDKQNAVREIQILAKINNPNVIGYKAAFIDGERLCLVMEYAEKGDLERLIKHYKQNGLIFSEKQIVRVVK